MPALGRVALAKRGGKFGAEHLEIDRCGQFFQWIAMRRQFLQPVIHIPKARLLSHGITPHADGSIESQNSPPR
jgi:hypothetical protein